MLEICLFVAALKQLKVGQNAIIYCSQVNSHILTGYQGKVFRVLCNGCNIVFLHEI